MRYTTLLLEWPVLVALFVWQGIRTPDGGLAQDAGWNAVERDSFYKIFS